MYEVLDIKLEAGKVMEVFSTPGGLDPIFDELEKVVDNFEHDIETPTGRKATASLANKVAKFKVYLDGIGKDLVSEWKEKSKAVDNERKKLRDRADALKARAREPLTRWEEAEKRRVDRITRELAAIQGMGDNYIENSHDLKETIAYLENLEIGEYWQEMREIGYNAREQAIIKVKAMVEKATKAEEDAIELARLREAEELRMEAEAKAKAEADRLAHEETLRNEERQRVEREQAAKVAAEIEAREKAERDAAEAADRIKRLEEERAEAEAQAIIAKANAIEKAKIDAQILQEKAERKAAEELAARQADISRVTKLKTASKLALIGLGLTEEQAIEVVLQVVAGKIENFKFIY